MHHLHGMLPDMSRRFARRSAGLALACALFAGFGPARAATNYSLADAAYVTTSRNIDVLDYVVCLEAAVNRSPEAMPLAEALRGAAAACRDIARSLPDSPDEPTAKDLVDKIRECGFFPEQASADADCGGSAPSQAGAADEVELSPVVIDVGKWPEGITFDDEWLWVAESGDRSIAKVNVARGRVQERRKVGRLPVDMATAGEGVVYTLVVTDKLINKQDTRGRSSTLAKLTECPEAMADGIDFLWVVTLPNCSSESSRLVRIDPRTGKQAKTALLGEWAVALASQGPDVWIAHARAPALTAVNQTSMQGRSFDVADAVLWSISSNSMHVFAGGHATDVPDDGLVVMIDPTNGEELARASVSERVSEIISDEDDVIAVGDKGTIWIYAAADLSLRRTITVTSGPYEPRDIIVLEDRLALSVANVDGENGAIFLLDDWLPAGVAGGGSPTLPASPKAAAPQRNAKVLPPPAINEPAKPPRQTTAVAPPPVRNPAVPGPRTTTNPPRKTATPPAAKAGFPIAAGSWGGNVRREPGMNAAWVASLKEGEPVTLLERTGEVMNGYPWFRIRFRGNQTGYKWGGILCATVKPVAGIESTCPGARIATGNPTPLPGGNVKPLGKPRPPVNGNTLRPRTATAGDISAVLGAFQRDPVENDGHIGRIVRDGANLRWTNQLGISWGLTADLSNDRLITGRDNPYRDPRRREFRIIRDHGDVVGFRFGSDTYLRVPETRVLITPPPDAAGSGGGAIRERDLVIDAGAGASVVSDGIPRGGRDAYRVSVRAGEILTVSVSAPDDNAAFEIRVGGAKGKALPGAAEGQGTRFFSDLISRDGDYLIIIGPRFGGTDYTLTVSLDIQQQPGVDGHEDGESEIAAEPAEDPRAKQDYSMVSPADRDSCANQHSVRLPAFFDCLDGFKQKAAAANPDPGAGNATAAPSAPGTTGAPAPADPRAGKVYNLAMGALATCAKDHGEGTSAYYDCLDVMEANEAANNAAAAPQAPTTGAPAPADPREGNDYGMIDHDARKECIAQHGDRTPASFDCLDAEKAKVEARQAQQDQLRLEEEARLEKERLAEEARVEQERLAEEARLEQERLAEEARVEQERLAEEARVAEQERLAEEARLEQERLAEEARLEQERLAEEARLEQERLDEEARLEQERLDEEARLQAEADALAQQQQTEEAPPPQ